MLRRIGVTVGLAFVTVAAASSAAEPVTHAIDYDNVHIRVLDPDRAANGYVSALGARLSTPPAPGTAQVTFGTTVITITKGKLGSDERRHPHRSHRLILQRHRRGGEDR